MKHKAMYGGMGFRSSDFNALEPVAQSRETFITISGGQLPENVTRTVTYNYVLYI